MELNIIISQYLLFQASKTEPAPSLTGQAFRLENSVAASPERITEAEGKEDELQLKLDQHWWIYILLKLKETFEVLWSMPPP